MISLVLIDNLSCLGKWSLRINERDEGWMLIIYAVNGINENVNSE